jgi:hypothetical protein
LEGIEDKRNLHHRGTEDTEKNAQTAEDTGDAEDKSGFDAAGLQSRPG